MHVKLEIHHDTIYATAYVDGKAVATVMRRGAYENAPLWRVYDLNSQLIYDTEFTSTPRLVASHLACRIEQHLTGKES